MGWIFTLDKKDGFLDWQSFGGSKQELTTDEAAVVAAAETAAGLRSIATAINHLADAVKATG